MGIASQLQRLQDAKAALKTALNTKGCTLTTETIDAYAAALNAIKTTEADYKAFIERSINDPVFPDGLTKIGDGACFHCSGSLTSLPSGVTYIGASAFGESAGLALTSLPSGVTHIGVYAFGNCPNLALTTLPSITEIPSQAFANDTKLVIKKVPSGVTLIGNRALQNCVGIKKIWLPASVTTIDTYNGISPIFAPFYGCTGIAAIYCQAASKPSGWQTYWNYKTDSAAFTTYWGITEAAFDALG